MPDKNRHISAIHYFYLLKDDLGDLQKVWSLLTSPTGSAHEQPIAAGLGLAGEGSDGYCKIVHRVPGEDLDFCLMMLTDLYAVELIYHRQSAPGLKQRWQKVLDLIEADRSRLLAGEVTIFGETTVMVTEEASRVEIAQAITGLMQAEQLITGTINPILAGGTKPLLVNLISNDKGRDFYALSAPELQANFSEIFPQVDSLIKKLKRSSAYFEEQRNAIIGERTEIDRQVGSLLHRQVVTGGGELMAEQLEEQIARLSKMYGMLATDSLLVRQAADRLERDLNQLKRAFDIFFTKADGEDAEGGEGEGMRHYYLNLFGGELVATHTELKDLNFSRENAQAAIEVVRTQVELLRAGEEAAIQGQTKELLSRSLLLQQERLALQVAAGFVEFVLVFYYVLKSWEGIAGQSQVEHIPPLVRLVVIGSMAASAAVGTHFLARSLHQRSWKNPGLLVSVAILALSLAAMVVFTITSNNI